MLTKPIRATLHTALRIILLTAILNPIAGFSQSCPALLNHQFLRLQDEVPQNLCQYQGDVILIVNTASYCGFTPQYQALEKLQARYGSQGFTVLGFPSNDYGQQEPGSNKEIADFCKNTYDVQFPMFAKSSVAGKNQNALFKELSSKTGTTPKWNFYKYLVDRHGNVVDAFNSLTAPDSSSITKKIEQLISEPR